MTEPPLKVLCITGWCRNGSTIIGNVLNELPDFFHVGELHFLWKNAAGRGANNLCGCGRPLPQCTIWSQILPLGRPAGMSAEAYADVVVARQRAYVRTRHTWRVLRHGLYCDGIREHADLMQQVYHAIAKRTGATVPVDTNKIPGESALLSHLAGIESYWYGFNLAAEALTRRHSKRSLTVRYEEFIADPAATLAAILGLCGAESSVIPLQGRVIELGVNHTVTGNPDRFRSGATVIRDADDSWKASLPTSAKLAAAALSWPLFWRYGYRYAPHR